MVKCGVLFEVRTGFLNTIYTSFGFKGLMVLLFLVKNVCILSLQLRIIYAQWIYNYQYGNKQTADLLGLLEVCA
jgi:hypothetical protein